MGKKKWFWKALKSFLRFKMKDKCQSCGVTDVPLYGGENLPKTCGPCISKERTADLDKHVD